MLKKINEIRQNKVVGIVYNILEYFVFSVIIVYLIMITFQRVSNNSSVFGYRMFTVASESMKPVYVIGDVLLVKDVAPSSLKIGDDITYYGRKGDMKDKIVTHRIIDIDDNGARFMVKGLDNPVADPEITSDQIYGKVVYKAILITFISALIHNQYGFFFLVFSPLVIIVFLEMANIIEEMKTKHDKA